jgi:hypothetical protein
MEKTFHAEKRMQQRGLSESILEIIINSGQQEQAPEGAVRIFFGNREFSRVMNKIKKYQKLLERAKNGTVIIKDDQILTVYKNQKA